MARILKAALLLSFLILTSCATGTNSIVSENDSFMKNREIALSNAQALEPSANQSQAVCLSKNWEKRLEKTVETIKTSDEMKVKELATLADCLALGENFPRALFYYDLALANSSDKPSLQSKIYNNMSNMYFYSENPEFAEHLLQKSIQLNPSNLSARYKLALMHYKLGEYEVSLSHLGELERRLPGNRAILAGIGANLYLTEKLSLLNDKVLTKLDDKSNEYLFFSTVLRSGKALGAGELEQIAALDFKNQFLEELKRKLLIKETYDGEKI